MILAQKMRTKPPVEYAGGWDCYPEILSHPQQLFGLPALIWTGIVGHSEHRFSVLKARKDRLTLPNIEAAADRKCVRIPTRREFFTKNPIDSSALII
jgi:hypothetical protein